MMMMMMMMMTLVNSESIINIFFKKSAFDKYLIAFNYQSLILK